MIAWVSFNLATGNSLASLPGLLVDYPIQRSIGAYETASAHLIIDGTQPVNWVAATEPGAALLACYDDEDSTQAIMWAGFVSSRARNAQTDTIDLTVVTTEGYLDRRFVSPVDDPYTYENVGQNVIAAALVETYVATSGGIDGLPITVVYTEPGDPGPLISQTYRDADNGTVYEALQALSALTNGPEWIITWAWRTDMAGITASFHLGSRIGNPAPATGSPDATFEMPGAIITATLTEDYSSDKGSNAVFAFTSTSGISPSGYIALPDPFGRPRFEFRFEPLTAIDDTSQLVTYATRAARNMLAGGLSVALVADISTAPRLGVSWDLGDDIGYVIGGLSDSGDDSVPVFPGGFSGIQRAIAVQISDTTITPIAATPPPFAPPPDDE